MDSGIITILLPIALAVVMAGMGLKLTVQDFARVSKHPKAVLVALFCQLVLLVGIAFVICKVLKLPPLLAVGLMLLAASPGGATASLFSYLYKGDIALNITLTAINAVIAAFFLPFVVNFALVYFMDNGQQLGMQFAKILQLFVIILIPVAVGMLIRHYKSSLADKLDRPVRIFALVFLVVIIFAAIFKARHDLIAYFAQIGLATALFCTLSLLVGYFVPRMVGINSFQARACAFEIGIHNSTLAMTIALTIMANATIAIPAAVYSIFMYVFAVIFGALITRGDRAQPLTEVATALEKSR